MIPEIKRWENIMYSQDPQGIFPGNPKRKHQFIKRFLFPCQTQYGVFGETVLAVPNNFPACLRAQKVQKRAAKSGMDFLSSVSAAERLEDELKELIEAQIKDDAEAVFDEAGDVLFSAVNTCRLAGADCEEALRAATQKFTARFVKCEQLIIADGKDITDLNELELDVYWHKAKKEL